MQPPRMVKDDWQAESVEYQEVVGPSWDQIETALQALDGFRRTEVIIGDVELANLDHGTGLTSIALGDCTASLSVGGGANGQYTISADFATPQESRGYYLLDPSQPERPRVDMVVGGQGVDYPLCLIVDLKTVFKAARYFIETGHLDPELTWTEEPPDGGAPPRDWGDLPW